MYSAWLGVCIALPNFRLLSAPNSSVHFQSCSFSTLYSLITKQKAAIRIISNKKYNDHTEPLFKEVKMLPLPDLITLFNFKFVRYFVHIYIPLAFSNSWTMVRVHRDDSNEFYIPRHRTGQIARLTSFNLYKTGISCMANFLMPKQNMPFLKRSLSVYLIS